MTRFQQNGHALGSEVILTLLVKHEPEAQDIFKQLWVKITSFENRFSRFISSSELSLVNHSAGSPTPISPDFKRLISAAVRLSNITEGIYNPFVLPALQKAGYVGSWPEPSKFNPALDYKGRQPVVDPKHIKISGNNIQIPANSALDFGGIGKGYLLDELATLLKKLGVQSYWLSLGGDIICSGFNLENTAWKIGVAKYDSQEEPLTYIVNPDGQDLAVATSGITKRRGQNWHHIIDPRSGLPAETNVQTATITSSTATEADVFAKCVVILDEEAAKAFIEKVGIKTAVIQTLKNNIIDETIIRR